MPIRSERITATAGVNGLRGVVVSPSSLGPLGLASLAVTAPKITSGAAVSWEAAFSALQSQLQEVLQRVGTSEAAAAEARDQAAASAAAAREAAARYSALEASLGARLAALESRPHVQD